MTRRIFCAGSSSKVIDDKWPAFEKGTDGFNPDVCAFMLETHFDRPKQDRGIMRNGAKIRSVQVNAQLVVTLKTERGSAGRFFADWPDADHVGRLELLKKRGSHLGGDAAARFLRVIGNPSYG